MLDQPLGFNTGLSSYSDARLPVLPRLLHLPSSIATSRFGLNASLESHQAGLGS